ncbi:uncharacterized WD repeat-containing protein C17D11.16-like [Olea europaea var. sylvestris]|uniref:uncharacterized WD repeat-containing protein C17D11.16-like n=1 Tax=Olea europaea var. sylvestris TaxID=158386 RepID=UPI000C1D0A02|nr:uncharacterized WD repeat-containing protein C17D11.16-like [Olea europaea var. sylvestris]
MIAAISWVPKGASKSIPAVAEPPSKGDIEDILKSGVMEKRDDSENQETDEDMDSNESQLNDEVAHALVAADALGKASKSTNPITDSITDALKDLEMDRYDEEDDGVELFGSGLGNLYYPSNDVDPYLKDNNDEDDSDEEEDTTIKPEDAVIVCARNEDDVSHLEVWILEDAKDGDLNMYVHHDIIISAFPLCTAWLDCPLKGGEKGNFVAVGTMDPAIEIWDLDVMDEIQPSTALGGVLEKKKKGKKVGLLIFNFCLGLVSKYDISCLCFQVQAVAWNHFASQVLLSGSFDHSVVMKDGRIPHHSGFKWSVAADVESLAWDPHTEHSFVVSLENGMVAGFDIRAASSDSCSEPKPCFTLHAHDKAVCTISYNSFVPNV